MIPKTLKTGLKISKSAIKIHSTGNTPHTITQNNTEKNKQETLALRREAKTLSAPYSFSNPYRSYLDDGDDLNNAPLQVRDADTSQEITQAYHFTSIIPQDVKDRAAAFQHNLNWTEPDYDAAILENMRVLDAKFQQNLEALRKPYDFENPFESFDSDCEDLNAPIADAPPIYSDQMTYYKFTNSFETFDSDCEDFNTPISKPVPVSSNKVLSKKTQKKLEVLEVFNEALGTSTFIKTSGSFVAPPEVLDHLSNSMVAATQNALFSNDNQDVWQAALVENWSRVDAHIDFLSKNLPIASYGIGEDNQHSKPVHFFHGLENLLKRTRFAGKEMDYQSLSDYTRLLAFTGFILSKKSVLKEIIQSYGSIDSSFCFVLPSSLNITFDIVQKQDQQGKKINGQFIVKIYIQSQDHFDRAWVLHSNKETFTKSAFSGSSHIELTIEYDFSKPLHDEQGQKKPLFPFEARLGTLWALPFDQEVFIHPEKYANSSDNAAHNAMIEQLIANRKAFNAESPEKHAARKNDILALTRDVMKVTSLNLSYEINT